MLRCHGFLLAAWIAVCGPPWSAGQVPDQGVESPLIDSELPEFLAAAPEEKAVAKPLWPRTWELGPNATLQLRGRVDTDVIWSEQSAANQASFGDLQDTVGIRRARIGVAGELGLDRRYVAEIDLATGDVVPRDVFLGIGSREAFGEGQFGHFREPFSLEGGTSARYFAFMERSPVNLLDPARNWGAGLFREALGPNSSLAFGVFHAGAGAGDFQSGPGSTVGFTGRLTRALVNENEGERLFHLGLALSERVPEHGFIIVNQQPRSSLLELEDSSTSPFVSSIRVPASFQQLINLQCAAAKGPWWTQAEWYGSIIDQTGGGAVFFQGCHVDCGYFVTGEHRAYEAANGTLGTVRVNRPWLRGRAACDRPRGWGALELTARYSYLDFFDQDTPPAPNGQLVGIRLAQPTFGVNWYLSDRVRLTFNYSYDRPDELNVGTSTANVFGTRLAVFW